MEDNLRNKLLTSIMAGDHKYAQLLKDELETTEQAEKLQEARATIEKYFDARDFIKTVNPDEFRAYIWTKVKNHETLTPMDRLKLATIQAFESDMGKIEAALNENIGIIIKGGEA